MASDKNWLQIRILHRKIYRIKEKTFFFYMTLNDNNTGKFMANVPYFYSMNERDTYELSHKTKYVSQIFLILLIKRIL